MTFNLSNIFRRDRIKLAFGRIGTPKTFKGFITQSGTSAPVLTILHNALGEVPVMAYSGVGSYTLTFASGVMTEDKTVILKGSSPDVQGVSFFSWNDATSLLIESSNLSGVSTNGIMYQTGISIEVFD